jgi:hypothetical protein
MLTMVPLRKQFIKKLIFLHGLKPWVRKFVYQKMDITYTCQGLIKMVECMGDKGPLRSKGEIGNEVT